MFSIFTIDSRNKKERERERGEREGACVCVTMDWKLIIFLGREGEREREGVDIPSFNALWDRQVLVIKMPTPHVTVIWNTPYKYR